MFLDIVTPEKKLLSEEIDALTVHTVQGEITILPHHESLVTQLVSGEAVVTTKGKSQFLGLTGGFLEVSHNRITILADYAIKAEDIIIEKAVAAQKRADEVLKKSKEGLSERDLAAAQSEMAKALMELHIANRRKRRTV
jgi:F-type H+-transporting ATPase subunit epsilon